MKKSFFEYLGMANIERVHSQILAWILSDNCTAIDQAQKNALLSNILGLKNHSNINYVQTEVNDMDILVMTDREVVVIENKFKSGQHSNQLNRYRNDCENMFKDKPKYYVYLTLMGDDSKSKEWISVSYNDVYNYMKDLKLEPGISDSFIFQEYLKYLERLTEVVSDFNNNPQNYRRIFLEGGLSRNLREINKYVIENDEFISTNRLETILQKGYLHKLINKINHSDFNIDDSRGCALLDLYLKRDIKLGDRRFLTMLELQKDNIKFAFTVQEGYEYSSKSMLKNAIELMKELSKFNDYSYYKLNVPKRKAYVSISKKLSKNYWEMNETEFLTFIHQEIQNGLELSQKFEELLNREMSIHADKESNVC